MSVDSNIMRSGFLSSRIIHLHPTRLCNLACLHCYSESGPKQKAALTLDSMKAVLPLLKEEGYEQISLSGGEPLAYPSLGDLIRYGKDLGYRVTMISNGLYPYHRLKEVGSMLDGMAVSFDGLAPIHNHLRGRNDAFERAISNLAQLAGEGIPVAAAVSLTADAIADLPELAYELAGLGITAIQVRPVALAGRAREMTGLRNYSASDRARLYLVVLALQQELGSVLKVHSDLAPARGLWQQRDAYAALLAACEPSGNEPAQRALSDLINPLVITETGALKPIAYDFNPDYNVGSIEKLTKEEIALYKQNKLAGFQAVIRTAFAHVKDDHALVDWFDLCTRLSESNNGISDPILLQEEQVIGSLKSNTVCVDSTNRSNPHPTGSGT